MAYFEVDESVLDGLDEEIKAKFKAYTPEDVSGLKNKANEAVNEVKAARAKAKLLEAELAEAKLNKPAGDADKLQQQLDDANSKLAESQSAYAELQNKVVQTNIQGEAGKLAAMLTKDTAKASLLAEKIAGRLSLDDGEIKVLDASGKLTVSSTDELANEIKGAFPFLVDGSPAQGGGATGTRGGAKADVKEVGRSDFDNMGHYERSKFLGEGGKVIDA